MSAIERERCEYPPVADNRRGRLKTFLIAWANSRPLLFGAAMTFAMMAAKMPMIPFVEMSGGASTTDSIVMVGVPLIIVSFVVLPIETLIGQTFPIWLMRRIGVRRWRWLILGSSLLFGAIHLTVDVGSFFVGFGGGIALSLCWLAWREGSFMKAMIGTTAVHALHNAIAFGVFFLFAV